MSIVSTYDEIPSRNALIFAWQNSLAVVAHDRRRSKKLCRRCGHHARRAGTVRFRYPGDEVRRGARLLDVASAVEPRPFGVVAGLPPRASGFLPGAVGTRQTRSTKTGEGLCLQGNEIPLAWRDE